MGVLRSREEHTIPEKTIRKAFNRVDFPDYGLGKWIFWWGRCISWPVLNEMGREAIHGLNWQWRILVLSHLSVYYLGLLKYFQVNNQQIKPPRVLFNSLCYVWVPNKVLISQTRVWLSEVGSRQPTLMVLLPILSSYRCCINWRQNKWLLQQELINLITEVTMHL